MTYEEELEQGAIEIANIIKLLEEKNAPQKDIDFFKKVLKSNVTPEYYKELLKESEV